MLADRREFPCQVVDMSPDGMALIAPVTAAQGERIIAYVDHLGRLEGRVARIFQNGFAMTIGATARKRAKLAAQLTWLANRNILGLPEDRRHGRIVPRNPVGRRRYRHRPAAADWRAGYARDHTGPRRASPRRRLRRRVHARLRDVDDTPDHAERRQPHLPTRLQHPDFLEDNVTGG
jgi:hypothetical protein